MPMLFVCHTRAYKAILAHAVVIKFMQKQDRLFDEYEKINEEAQHRLNVAGVGSYFFDVKLLSCFYKKNSQIPNIQEFN